jgi:hypothetical protein
MYRKFFPSPLPDVWLIIESVKDFPAISRSLRVDFIPQSP